MDRTERRAAVKFSILRSKSARYGLSARMGCRWHAISETRGGLCPTHGRWFESNRGSHKKREDKRSLFFCGSPCCPNELVCESRIGSQVCEANLMRAGSAGAGSRNLKGCASLQSKPDELREGKQTDNLLYSDKSKKRDRSNVECSKRRRATIRIRLFVM